MVLYRVCGWPSAGVQESQEGRAECGWHSPRCSLTFGPCCAQAVLDASHEVHYLVFTQRSNLGTVSRLNCLLPVVRLDGPLTWQPHYPAAFLGEPVVRRKGNEPAQAYPGYPRACWGRACEVSVHTRLRLLLRKSLSFPWAPSWQRVSWGVGEGVLSLTLITVPAGAIAEPSHCMGFVTGISLGPHTRMSLRGPAQVTLAVQWRKSWGSDPGLSDCKAPALILKATECTVPQVEGPGGQGPGSTPAAWHMGSGLTLLLPSAPVGPCHWAMAPTEFGDLRMAIGSLRQLLSPGTTEVATGLSPGPECATATCQCVRDPWFLVGLLWPRV